MCDKEFKELVKIAVEKLKDKSVLKLLKADASYQKDSNNEGSAEDAFNQLDLTEKQRAVCQRLLDCRDKQDFEYGTHAYLSGNVREKSKVAEIAAKSAPELAVNVAALEKVISKDLPASEISVRLDTTWIPQEDIQQFMMELLTSSSYAAGRLQVRYTVYNGDWFIENKSSYVGNVKADSTYGTKRASAYRIMEDTLNLRDTRIFDYIYDEHNNKKAVPNHKETTAVQAKQEVIKQAFGDWIWKDPERRNRLVRYYNDTFNSIRPREYDGSHIAFGGISPEIQLRPHQVNAIAHILYGGNTLLAHKVGAGKTFEMVAAAQESKRLGLCQKSISVFLVFIHFHMSTACSEICYVPFYRDRSSY